jgi:hypothetical protein
LASSGHDGKPALPSPLPTRLASRAVHGTRPPPSAWPIEAATLLEMVRSGRVRMGAEEGALASVTVTIFLQHAPDRRCF